MIELNLEMIVSVAGGIITVFTLAKLVVKPFVDAIQQNNRTMTRLDETVKKLTHDLEESKEDRINMSNAIDTLTTDVSEIKSTLKDLGRDLQESKRNQKNADKAIDVLMEDTGEIKRNLSVHEERFRTIFKELNK